MKVVLFLAAIVTGIVAKSTFTIESDSNPVVGYLKNIGIPRAQVIREAEDAHQKGESRIFGGQQASLGQFPYQAGLVINLFGEAQTAVCGGSLVSSLRVLTAAHCWFDGMNQATRMTVVLGSIFVFTGGTRLDTGTVVMHPNWAAFDGNLANDIAVVYLPRAVSSSNTIAPIALPSGSQLNENFAGSVGVVSGFGVTGQGVGIGANQFLNFINVNVIANADCVRNLGSVVQSSNVCSRGIGNTGACASDSGGPLAITRNNRPLLIGVLSFGPLGCGGQMTNAFARVTSFTSFISQNL